MITNYFVRSDQFICIELSQEFCLKTTQGPGDFECEIEMNGFEDALNDCEGEMMLAWNSDKWAIFCILFLFAPFVKQSTIFGKEEEEEEKQFSKMIKIRNILVKNQTKRQEQGIRAMRFADLWAVGVFTASSRLCSQFQSDLRKSTSGCKWKHMQAAFGTGLKSLQFVQNMGWVF